MTNEAKRRPGEPVNGLIHIGDAVSAFFSALDQARAGGHTPPVYSPPYDSPLEDYFAWHLIKYSDARNVVDPQHEVRTLWGKFRIDFVVTTASGRRIGFECDGRELHQGDRDGWRDAVILGSNGVDVIYRLRGCDIHYHVNDALFVVGAGEPGIFSERGANMLRQLSRPASRSIKVDGVDENIVLPLREQVRLLCIDPMDDHDSERGLQYMRIVRRDQGAPGLRRPVWRTQFDFAESLGSCSLDTLIASYRSAKSSRGSPCP